MRFIGCSVAIASVLGLGAALPARAQAASGDPPPSQGEAARASSTAALPSAQKSSLPNGLEVLFHEDRRMPVVCVDVWYHVGALNEEPGKSGFAHLFEHLMFQGSAHVPGDSHLQLLEAAGASVLNGTTNFDRTSYFECVPKSEVELALWLESDRMGWLTTGMTAARLDEQRNVVKNERRAGLENRPYGSVEEKAWQALFPASHPYAGAVIGSMADLDRATLQDVIRFHDTYYAPSNATVAIVGDIDRDEALKLIAKYFGTLPPWPKPAPPVVAAPSLEAEVRLELEDPLAPLAKVSLSFLVPPAYQPGDAELEILTRILGDGNASRLHQALVVGKKLAQEVEARHEQMQNVSVLTLSAVVKPDQSPEAVLAALIDELELLNDLPPGDDEVLRVVNKLEAEKILVLQLPIARAEVFQHYNHFLGEPNGLEQDLARLRAVTGDSIGAAIKAHLARDKRVILIARPRAATSAPAADAKSTKGGA